MDILLKILREEIPSSTSQKWEYEIDVSHSCFCMEHTSMEGVVLSGTGHENLEDVMVRIEINFRVEKSRHVRRVLLKKKGVQAALTSLFRFPENHAICRECGVLRLAEDDRAHCESCLFLEVYSDMKREGSPPDLCSICQEPAFRTMLPCGHVFHMTCLLSMNPHQLRCPNCREALPSSMIRQCFGVCHHCGDEDDEEDDDEEEG
jgi:Ring finger domain